MSKSPHPIEFRIMVAEKYLAGEGSYTSLAKQYGVSRNTIKSWVKHYKEHGTAAFSRKDGNAQYSKEFKLMCVEAVLNGEGSVNDIIAKYNISDGYVLNVFI